MGGAPGTAAGRRPLRILAVASLMPPASWAGSEIALHAVLTELQRRGHDVRAMVRSRGGTYQGVTSVRADGRMLDDAAGWCDVMVGQQSAQAVIARLGSRLGKPTILWQHSWNHLEGPPSVAYDLVGDRCWVYANSESAAAAIREKGIAARVMRPLVAVADYRTERDRAARVGLVNLSMLKGGQVLWKLAGAQPDRLFVGRHGWGSPYPARYPANVERQPQGPDMAGFYSLVRVLVMPAAVESWGRVGLEAMSSGIPVVAHRTPGLAEALGDAAMWADRGDLSTWTAALGQLDDPAVYAERSARSVERAVEMERVSRDDLDDFEEHLMAIAKPRTAAAKPAAEPAPGDVAVLVPWKAGSREREQAWAHVQRHWMTDFPDWPLIEGVWETEPFNRSAALNQAAQAAGPHDVLIVADADTLIDGAQVLAAVRLARKTGRITFAHDEFRALNAKGTRVILAGDYGGSWDGFIEWRMRDTASSCLAVPSQLWEQVGGFDERFCGWGFEDVAFSLACQTVGGGFERVRGPIWHLHHEKSPTNRPGAPTLLANTQLSERYTRLWKAKDRDGMLELLAERHKVAA